MMKQNLKTAKTVLKNIIFVFSFPSNLSMSEKWCDALGLNLNDLPKYAYVCSRHFMRDEFTGSRTRKTIAKHAIPKHLHSIR